MARWCFVLALFAACTGDGNTSVDAGECVPGDCSATGQECGQRIDERGGCIICGRCPAPLLCGGDNRPGKCGCVPNVCPPDTCGEIDDGCGGTAQCGMCQGMDTCGGGGTANACGRRALRGESCGGTTVCAQGDACCEGVCRAAGPENACPMQPGPDLFVNEIALAASLTVEMKIVAPTDCSIADRCLPGPGTYRLLRFTTETVNGGGRDLVIGDPEDAPNDFMFAECHMHNHFTGYVVYRLLDGSGRAVTEGFKAGFCVEDTNRVSQDPLTPMMPKFFCDPAISGIQGIQAGWSDVYMNAIDCQWVNITGVAPGNYTLEIEVNPPPRRFHEASYDNNITRVPVTIVP